MRYLAGTLVGPNKIRSCRCKPASRAANSEPAGPDPDFRRDERKKLMLYVIAQRNSGQPPVYIIEDAHRFPKALKGRFRP